MKKICEFICITGMISEYHVNMDSLCCGAAHLQSSHYNKCKNCALQQVGNIHKLNKVIKTLNSRSNIAESLKRQKLLISSFFCCSLIKGAIECIDTVF